MEANKISVVIVSFNRVQQLRGSLTALCLPGAGPQVIVVDNGSRDGAGNLDAEFPTARFSKLPRNFGLTRALNIGIRAAEGDYILLLHDDVRIDVASVVALADFLESHEDAAGVCPRLNTPQVRALPTSSNPDPPLQNAPEGDEAGEAIVECVSGAALMVRAPFLRSMGHIDERYGNYGSAIEICEKIRTSNRKLVVLNRVTAEHGTEPSPMNAGTLKGDRASGIAAFIGKHYGVTAGLMHRLSSFTFGGTKIDGSS
jgi:GT2 family glycosyltransferase